MAKVEYKRVECYQCGGCPDSDCEVCDGYGYYLTAEYPVNLEVKIANPQPVKIMTLYGFRVE